MGVAADEADRLGAPVAEEAAADLVVAGGLEADVAAAEVAVVHPEAVKNCLQRSIKSLALTVYFFIFAYTFCMYDVRMYSSAFMIVFNDILRLF